MNLKGAIAVTRFGLGALPGEIERASSNPKTWLTQQITPESGQKSASSQAFDGLVSSNELYKLRRNYQDNRKTLRGDPREAAAELYGKQVKTNFKAEIQARSLHAELTANPFHERLTRFWSNHFSVSARSRTTRLFAPALEREAIRPNILGKFSDLAHAAVFHPAMLTFLDNASSVGPKSANGIKRGRGLNENLAREALELHTVTPSAGYTQTDVTEFAKALTGWSLGRDKNKIPRAPLFRHDRHEPGTRTVLGKRYKQGGKAQAAAILKDLSMRPETARNIAHKLAVHFVSDTPPKALVNAMSERFLDTQGDLTQVYHVLINSPLAWEMPALKVKTPEELFVSTSRAIGLKNVFPKRKRDSYDSLAQYPFAAPTPEGWPDMAQDWISPNAMIKRIEWANELATRLPAFDPDLFLDSALGPRASKDTRKAISRAESYKQAFALALLSPDFQRR